MHFNKSDWFLLCSCAGLHMVSSSHRHTRALFFSPSDECSVITVAARPTLFLPSSVMIILFCQCYLGGLRVLQHKVWLTTEALMSQTEAHMPTVSA